MQKIFASDWPMGVMVWPCVVLIPLFVVSLTICALILPFQTFALWQSVLLFLFCGTLSLILGVCLGLVGLFYVFVMILMPLNYVRARLNGSPFHPGDTVQILSGAYKGQITHVYEKIAKGFLRVELGQDAKSKGEDIFAPHQLLREEEAEPSVAQRRGKPRAWMMKSTMRKQFEQRRRLPDTDFVAQLAGPHVKSSVGIALRNEMARLCKLPPDSVTPSDLQCNLQWLIGDWDLINFVFVIEEALQCELPDEENIPNPFDLRCFWWKRPGPETFGQWVEKVTEWANNSLQHTC